MEFGDTEPSQSVSDDEEDELTTAAEVVKKLEEVWCNEKLAPELLNYEEELVECLLDQIQHMESSLEKIKKEDFRLVFHKMELDRIKFVLNSYLRTRLGKIESFCAFLLNAENENPSLRNLMSDGERNFAQKFISGMKEYLHEVALQHMPINMQSLPLEELGAKPDLNKSVFIRAKKDCRGVILEASSDFGGDEIVDLTEGSQHVLKYNHISSLMKRGSVQLI